MPRYSSLYDGKDLIVRFGEKQAELCTRSGKTIKALKVPTLYQVNYDTTIGKGMIVFTPHGTNRVQCADSWRGCAAEVSAGVYFIL